MPNPVWPVSLPTTMMYEGFAGELPNVVVSSAMDAGPPKVRRRFTAGVEPVQGKLRITSTQMSTLATFYSTTLEGGALRFDWTHPRTAAAATLRFRKPPAYRRLASDVWEVDLVLEVLP